MAKSIEGVSLLPILVSGGASELNRADPYFIFRYSRGPTEVAINAGRYKLMKAVGSDELFLYDLHFDIGERENLTIRMTEKAEELEARLQGYIETHGGIYEADGSPD